MARALALAAEGRGRTSPNPMVGAVIVRDGVVVGEGFHPRAGEPHAEVFALREAGERARGADMYVTLEPCSHHGRTGPCADAVIAAGIARVFVAQQDPNPLVAGRGLAKLAAAGIAVELGEGEAEARRLNEAFNHWIVTRRPFTTLKLATSLDGRIAAATGESQWITGPAARAAVHELRADSDAVVVGSRTAALDDPRLTVRDVERPFLPPLRVIVDAKLGVRAEARAFDPEAEGGALVATAVAEDEPAARALGARGVGVWSLPDGRGRVSLGALFARLGAGTGLAAPVTSALVEGGGGLASALWAAGLVDKVVWFVAPRLIGADGVPAFGPLGLARPADGPLLETASIERIGDDAMIVAYPARAPEGA